jgi:hypothetical protein
MAFMIPEYVRAPFLVCEDRRGEGQAVPADVMSREAFALECEIDAKDVDLIEDKWWSRLSAPGYMDCTDWHGPFESEESARAALSKWYDVDPDTGDDLGENDGVPMWLTVERKLAETAAESDDTDLPDPIV